MDGKSNWRKERGKSNKIRVMAEGGDWAQMKGTRSLVKNR